MRILILEDNNQDADLCLRALSASFSGCQVDVAPTLAQARNLLNVNDNYDIALLDMNLPDGNGLEFLTEIRERGLPLPVVVFTSSGNEEVAVAALKAGADDYISKKINFAEKLPAVITYAIENQQKQLFQIKELIDVLYIEHNMYDIDLTDRHFKKYAPYIHLDVVSSAEEALLKLPESLLNKSATNKYKIILMDYRLHGMTALDFIKIIRQEKKYDLPIIIVTGQGDEEISVQALKLGANDYLTKNENYLFRLPYLIMTACQQRELRRKQSELRMLTRAVEQSPDSVLITNIKGEIEYVNPSILRISGYSKDELIGKNPRIFNSGIKTESEYKMLWYTISNGNVWEGEFQNRKKNGELFFEMATISPVTDNSGKITHFLAIRKDITEQKRMTLELIKAKERAEESDRLKSAFLANMSHEIRTPMNGILGFSDLLRDPDLKTEVKDRYIEILHLSGQRMLNTVNDIIEISKIESGMISSNHTLINVNRTLEEQVQFFAAEASAKGLKLMIEKLLPQASSTLVTDQQKLNSILSNLIKNAIKYTDRGSVKVGCSAKKNHLEFYILDTGIGIPVNRREAIFDRFIQADLGDKRAFQGSGLGLSISKAYVEMIGGTIWVSSEEGNGSCFYFTLPCCVSNQENKPKIPDSQDRKTEKKSAKKAAEMKILIAEDDEVSDMLLTIEAKKIGMEIFKAGTGVMAVDICRRNPDIDLVFMDIRMPEMDGYEAIRQIRKFNKEVIIIAQTSYGFAGDKEKALEAGCNDYISKPIILEKLLALIRSYFEC